MPKGRETGSRSGKAHRNAKRVRPKSGKPRHSITVSLAELESERLILRAVFREIPAQHGSKSGILRLLRALSKEIKKAYKNLIFSASDLVRAILHLEHIRVKVPYDLWEETRSLPLPALP